MEDILSSIRRVIARDEGPGRHSTVRTVTAEDILDLQDREEQAPESDEPEEDELVSTASADAARQSLEALTAAIAPAVAAAAPAPTGGRTLEDVVLDALRPMLKDWLDNNLPPLVESMVAKEIRRITGQKS